MKDRAHGQQRAPGGDPLPRYLMDQVRREDDQPHADGLQHQRREDSQPFAHQVRAKDHQESAKKRKGGVRRQGDAKRQG